MTSAVFAQNWDMNDVSYLFPLPQKGENDFLLMPNSQKNQGALFPEKFKEYFKELVISYDAPKDAFQELRVVGMRIDPCFLYDKSAICHPQIRLVWQPLKEMSDFVSTYDAAAHSFYDLNQEEFKKLASDLKALKLKYKVQTHGLPLSIHPAMQNEKTRLAFSQELKNIILNYAGEKNLKQFTFMQFLTKDIWWRFGGFEVLADGSVKNLVIPRLKNANEPMQDFFNEDIHNEIGMQGTIMPMMEEGVDNLNDYISAYRIPDNEIGKKRIIEAFKIINKIENPQVHNTVTLDCVHCHIASPTRFWLETQFKSLLPQEKVSENHYMQNFLAPKNLKNVYFNPQKNKSLRAFGYFDENPSINQRVINETSSVVEKMNKMHY